MVFIFGFCCLNGVVTPDFYLFNTFFRANLGSLLIFSWLILGKNKSHIFLKTNLCNLLLLIVLSYAYLQLKRWYD